jgi:hypothetical protein
MKNLLLISVFLVFMGCQQLMNGQVQPVTIIKGNYFTTCGGAVETWGTCNNKALSTCPKGYDIISKRENSTGTERALTFVCKK